MRDLLLAAAFSVMQPDFSARPVTIPCDPGFPLVTVWGRMAIAVDEQAKHVRIEADDTSPGARVDYRDGAMAPIYTGRIYPWMEHTDEQVEQFVRITETRIEVGWLDREGAPAHHAWFDRRALTRWWVKCRWHVYWPLRRG